MFWEIFHHSEVTSESAKAAKQRPQTTWCVSSAFGFATATNPCQNLTLKVLVVGMKGNENGKLRHTGTACLQGDLYNFKGNKSFSAPFINSDVWGFSQNIALQQGRTTLLPKIVSFWFINKVEAQIRTSEFQRDPQPDFVKGETSNLSMHWNTRTSVKLFYMQPEQDEPQDCFFTHDQIFFMQMV